ncbi:protein trapped in endoderm-1-like [Penaeus monodon]|uniref:protein trapped in endoderm-1-like n=1 Tax=Penaeus monodon TaxID=6687 RepID=UPI0018A72703|nr:protein trapped in endoderm-1-like [Penaeus monodon]
MVKAHYHNSSHIFIGALFLSISTTKSSRYLTTQRKRVINISRDIGPDTVEQTLGILQVTAVGRLCTRRMSGLRPLVRQVTDIGHIISLIFLITATTSGTHATSDVATPGITVAKTAAVTTATTTPAVQNTTSTTIPEATQSSLDVVTLTETEVPAAPPVKDYRYATNTSPPAEITTAEQQANLRVYSPQILGFTAACVILTGIVGAVGNLLAALSLLNSRQLRQSPSTAFMVNLPACLLPVCVVGLPMFAVGCIQIQWYGRVLMPEWVCIFGFALGLTFSQVHLHTLCAIAFNRLVAVVWPAKYKRLMQAKVVKVYLALLWFYSALLWLPLTFGGPGRLVYVPKELMVSMKDDSPRKTGKAFHVFLTYLLPIMITSVCYIVMYFKVRQTRRRRPGARTKAGDEANLSEGTNVMRQWDDHVTRTILVIFVLLLVCSVPHLVIHVLHLHAKHPQAWLLLHVVFWLQFSLDPIIYVLMSQHYRLACLEFLQKVFPGMNTFRVSTESDRYNPKTDNSNQFLQGTKYEVRHSQRPDFGEESKNPMLIPSESV